jgi:hypothetical protein
VSSRLRWLPTAWAFLLATLLLGPALAPGYVLTYDMVWVPDLALRNDLLGLGSALPRAVPSDAVVAVLDEVVPGMLLQKLVLLGSLVAGGLGASRLVADERLAGRLMAVSVYQWNPFVAERLSMGHWPVLVTYAVLPWLIRAARRWRVEGRLPPSLCLLLPLASLSATGGVAAAVALAAFAVRRGRRRATAGAALLALAANAPWVFSGLLHASAATTDATGAAVFALRGEGSLPAPVAALGLGGIWNGEVVLPSSAGPLGWLFVGLLLVLCAAGARRFVARTPRRDVVGFVACWLVGWALAVLTWAAPDVMSWLVVHVPGAGLLRDGSRLLLLCAPLVTVLAGHGAAAAWDLLSRAGALRYSVVAALVVLPVTLLPDAALGLSGRLEPAEFPASYARARPVVARIAAEQPGDLLLLPLTSYRRPAWNHGRKVLDPLGRYLTPDYVASDELVVSGRVIAGEDPRAVAAARALRAATPDERAGALATLGVGIVVVDREAPGATPQLSGTVAYDAGGLEVLRLDGARPRVTPTTWRIAMASAWALFLAPVAAALASLVRHRTRRNSSGGKSRIPADSGSRC